MLKRTLHCIASFGLYIYIFCAANMWWQPLTTDENDFFLAIANWHEQRYLIPHPHLYVHWAQGLFALLGANVGALRLSVLLPNLATVALLVWLSRLICQDTARQNSWPAVASLAVALYGLNPLTVQNSVLIDIDNGLLTIALTGLLCLWLSLRSRPALLRVAVLSVAFAVCLWVKLPTPPILAAAITAYQLLCRRWGEAGLAVTFTLVGIVLFAAAHTVYGAVTGYTLSDAFTALAGRARYEILWQAPSNFVQTTGVMLFWLGLPFVVLIAPAAWDSLRRLMSGQSQAQDLGLIYVAGVFAFYGIVIVPAWGYPRYHTPALPILALVVSAWVIGQIKQASRTFWIAMLAIGIGGAAYLMFVVGDPMYDIYWATFETTDIGERLRIGGLTVALLAVPVLIVVAVSVLLARGIRTSLAAMLSGSLTALALGSSIAIDLIQSTAHYSTRYRYTYVYADRQRATEVVRANVPPNGYSLTDKDLLWYAGRPGEQIYPYLSDPAKLKATMRTRRIDVIAWAQKEKLKASALNANTEVLAILEQCYRSQHFGIFTVLTRTSNESCLGIR